MKFPVFDLDARNAGEVELADEVFGISEIRVDLVHRMVTWQLAGRRAGTHKVKTRSEIRTRRGKANRQKGSGSARHGSRGAPIFVGGGVAHGPRLRSHAIGLQKKVRALALCHALSAKRRDDGLIILDDAALPEARTGILRRQLSDLGAANALVVVGVVPDVNLVRAAGNIPDIDILPLTGMNVYDIVRRHKLVLTRAAVDGVHKRFGIETEQA